MDRACVVFADGQAIVLGAGERDKGADVLKAFFDMARRTLRHVRESGADKAVFRRGRIEVASPWSTVGIVHSLLHEKHPIRVEAGFEGNPGVEGGAWRPTDQGDDGLAHLRFSAGTEDLPLHVHEYSDRLLVVTSGIGVFHYLADADSARELRSLVVEANDVVIFTRGLIHTFTAPLGDMTLLSYHAPFFEFDDTRQFRIPASVRKGRYAWTPGRLAGVTNEVDAIPVAPSA